MADAAQHEERRVSGLRRGRRLDAGPIKQHTLRRPPSEPTYRARCLTVSDGASIRQRRPECQRSAQGPEPWSGTPAGMRSIAGAPACTGSTARARRLAGGPVHEPRRRRQTLGTGVSAHRHRCATRADAGRARHVSPLTGRLSPSRPGARAGSGDGRGSPGRRGGRWCAAPGPKPQPRTPRHRPRRRESAPSNPPASVRKLRFAEAFPQ